jgi:C4-dicarboxylate-specific signal transduction histidine kinase
MNDYIWKSRLARRLVRIFSVMVAASITVTVLIIDHVGQKQIVESVDAVGKINENAIQDAGSDFEKLSAVSSRQSSAQTAQISINALKSMSGKMERTQLDTMSAAVRNFSGVSRASLDGAVEKSTATNSAALNRLSDQMTNLVARSTRDSQAKAARRVESAALATTGAELEWRAKDLSSDIQNYIATYQSYLSLTAQMPQLSDGHMDGDQATLDALVRRYPMFTRVSEVDDAGKEIVTSSSEEIISPSEMGQYGTSDFFRTCLSGKTYVGVLSETSDDGAPIIRLGVPIEAYRGKVVGVLLASLSLSDLWDSLRNMRFGQDGYVYVLNKPGKPLLAPRRVAGSVLSRRADVEDIGWQACVAVPLNEVMQPVRTLESEINESSQEAVLQMRASIKKSGQLTTAQLSQDARSISSATDAQLERQSRQAIDGLKVTTSKQAQVELAGMQSAIKAQSASVEERNGSQMRAAAADETRRLANRVPALIADASHNAHARFTLSALILTILSCAVGCVVALYIARRIVRPVLLLVQGTHAIAQGDLDERVDENAPDEIGDLAAAFNHMAASLKKSRGDLQDAESQLVQSAKLASLGTLSAGVAHELNQPLAIIRGVSQQLSGEPGLSDDAIADLKLIEGQTSRMTKIIKHLRTFCRAGSFELTQVDVNEVVNNCFILIGAQLKAHNVQVQLALCDQAPRVMADANELEQVFLNLITNSRDAIEERPGACITIRSRVKGDRFVVEFHDNGPGIPEDVAKQIFDPFFTTKEAGKGTGLGLSISHSIIEKHRGTIEFKNDNGALFIIDLPVAQADQPEVIYRMAEAA